MVGQRAGPGHRHDDDRRDPAVGVRHDQILTLVAFVGVALIALVFDKNIGFVSITAAVILAMLAPQQHKDAVRQIAWPTVLLVAGVSTYATILTTAGSPEFVGNWAAGLGAAAIGALILCYVGGVVSAFASSTALLPVIIPIAAALIANGGISAAMFVAALAVSSTIVDVSPFSTNGALMLANRPDTITEPVYYKQILTYSVIVVLAVRCWSGPPSSCRAGDDDDLSSLHQGPLDGVLVVDLPAPCRAARHDDARRPRRPGDQGRGSRTRRRHPRLGTVRRRPDARQSTYFLRPTATRSRRSRPQGRGRPRRPAAPGRPGRRARRELPHRRPRAARPRDRRAAGAQPAAGRAVDHRVRPRRPGGRARGLRPDRPGRGRADVADRLRTRRPAAGGRPDRRPACRDVRRVRRRGRAPRAESHRHRHRGPNSPAAVVGVHAFQGTRWTVAGEVGRAQGNHHPSIAPYGLFHCRDGSVQIALGSEGLWRRLCDGFALDPDTPGLATNAERVADRARVIEVVESVFATWDAEPLLARLAELGVPAGKVRTLDEVYAWDQTASQGPLVDVDHPPWAG